MKYILTKPGILFVFVAACLSTRCTNEQSRDRQHETSTKPNILFCIADDATYKHMGAYGTKWVSTPAFDRVAGEGILFERAYTPNAKCAPSRSSILTGRNSWQLKEAANHWPVFPGEFKTFPEVLAENGYHVGYTGKGWAPGLPGKKDGQPRQLIGPSFNSLKKEAPTSSISTVDYSANFKDFLDKNDAKPWFFWYGGHEPHRAYEYGSGISKGGKKISDVTGVPNFWPDNDTVRTDMLDYAFEIEYFDSELNKMLQHLEATGQLENTMVVVTADNGMPFPRIKGQEYEYSNHLPLAVMWQKGILHGNRKVSDFISFIDFAPTFLELAGVDWESSGMSSSPGKSMTDILFSEQQGQVSATREYVLIGKERHDVGRPNDEGYPIRGIFKDNFLYLKNFEPDRWPAGNPKTGYLNCDGSPTKSLLLDMNRQNKDAFYWHFNFGKRDSVELYNIVEDPNCLQNLVLNKDYKATLDNLNALMMEKLHEQEDPRVNGQGHLFDEYLYADEKTYDFYNRYMSGEQLKAGWVEPTDFEKMDADSKK
ncbi:MAG: sulfatase [Cyclobacteriaceae bacterium]|nr:sulfatase [Cyclobacteriaceae bacterium]